MSTLFSNTTDNRNLSLPTPIYFATLSQAKYYYFENIFNSHQIELRHGTALADFQIWNEKDNSNESKPEIIFNKLRHASRFAEETGQTPYILEQSMLFIEHFSKDIENWIGLPGVDTQNWWMNLGSHGVLEILSNIEKRTAKMVCQIGVYLGESRYKFASGEIDGFISKEIKSGRNYLQTPGVFPFHDIFVPCNSEQTLAEFADTDASQFDYKRKSVQNLLFQLSGN